MKTVLIIRHAKSSWDDPAMADFDRPLNERGKNDAPKMADRLLAKSIRIDTFISSPAKRAKKTAEVFARKYNVDKTDILLIPTLYESHANIFFDVIEKAPQKSTSIAIFSHNPGITDFVNKLTATRIDNMPTCAVFAVKADVERWQDFRQIQKHFLFFDFPKSMHED